MADFTMPTLGADMDQGTLLEWRVAVGDLVTKGDIVALIDTEKSTVEIEVFESGVVEELLVDPGTEVPVGTPLARIGTGVGNAPTPTPAPQPTPTPGPTPTPTPTPDNEPSFVTSPLVRHLAESLGVDTGGVQGTGVGHRITRADIERAAAGTAATIVPTGTGDPGSSPRARRRAEELGVEISAIAGSGPGGAVLERDIRSDTPMAVPEQQPAPERGRAPKEGDERRASIRGAIARVMTISNREIPHYHLALTVDLHDALAVLDRHNAERPPGERVLPAALLLRAVALAARRHRELNGFWIDQGFVPADGVHLGVAISLRGGGLVAPAIRDADRLDVDEMMTSLRDLVARTRRSALRGSELTGASITVTNLGDRGAESVLGVIYPPQVALVGFGRIVERPWAVDGLVGVRPTVVATLSADHRATDGHVGSLFLESIEQSLHDPAMIAAPTAGSSTPAPATTTQETN